MREYLRRRWKAVLVLLVVLVGGCSWGMLEYTHQPKFCTSCHVMESYYEAWETSSHNEVTCVECHYPPGIKHEIQGKLDALNQVVAYMTGSYDTKFYAEIDDESCMRSGCHTEMPIEDALEFKRGIKFNHAHHYGAPVRGVELRCTSCHGQIVQGNHMAVNETTCFLCHFRNRIDPINPVSQEFCTNCHNYPQYQISAGGLSYNHVDYVERGVLCWRCHSDVIQGNGDVEDRACLQCHSDPNQIEKITDVEEVHINHVTNHKVECFNCHSNIIHAIPDVEGTDLPKEQASSCGTCHLDVHHAAQELYAGRGGRGVEDMPSTMYKVQVDCVGCHLDDISSGHADMHDGRTRLSGVEGCVDCHGEIGSDIYGFWVESMDAQLEETLAALDEMQTLLDKLDGDAPAELTDQISDATYNYNFVRYGKGVHNINYALALLEKSRDDAEQVIEKLRQ